MLSLEKLVIDNIASLPVDKITSVRVDKITSVRVDYESTLTVNNIALIVLKGVLCLVDILLSTSIDVRLKSRQLLLLRGRPYIAVESLGLGKVTLLYNFLAPECLAQLLEIGNIDSIVFL